MENTERKKRPDGSKFEIGNPIDGYFDKATRPDLLMEKGRSVETPGGIICIIGDQYRAKKGISKNTYSYIKCKCFCGKEFDAMTMNLRTGNTKSCGCYQDKINRKLKRKHGGAGTRLYHIWQSMKSRCYRKTSPMYYCYGGRGISVCEEWKLNYESFSSWAMSAGYSEELSIDRVNNDGNYEPLNCRWATDAEQARNTSRTVMLTAFGETKSMIGWSEDVRCVCGYNNLRFRIGEGWFAEDAISTPVGATPEVRDIFRSRISAANEEILGHELEFETWKPIPGWEFYDASDLGRIRSYWKRGGGKKSRSDKATILKLNATGIKGEQRIVTLYKEGGRKIYLVARLVLMAHVGMPDGKMEACHFPDPNPANCRLSNLRWDTRSGNLKDRGRLNRLLVEMIDD